MVKECTVLMTNDIVTVVRFGNIDVQLPSIKKNTKIVRVANENGKYFVVDETYKNNNVLNKQKPKKQKGTKNSHLTSKAEINDAH